MRCMLLLFEGEGCGSEGRVERRDDGVVGVLLIMKGAAC